MKQNYLVYMLFLGALVNHDPFGVCNHASSMWRLCSNKCFKKSVTCKFVRTTIYV